MYFCIYFLGFQKQNKNPCNDIYIFFEFLSIIFKYFALNYKQKHEKKTQYTKK